MNFFANGNIRVFKSFCPVFVVCVSDWPFCKEVMMGFDSEINKGWKKDETAALIALYESEQSLYDKNDPNYYDALKKNDAFERIRLVMLRIRPDCTLTQIKSRIKYIRSQYEAEKLRRDISIQSGLCTEESYKPSLWCFGLMQFLDDYLTPKQKKIKIEEIENEVSKESDSEDEVYQNEISCSKSDKQNYKDEAGSSLATDDNSNDEIIVHMGHSKKKRKLNNNELSPKKPMNDSAKTTAEISYDREDIFGQYVASEMRALRNNPVLYLQTKQSILEILTSANFELINPE